MIVTFCGHGDKYYDAQTEKKLLLCVEKLIKEGAKEFLLGGYGDFDHLAARTVKQLKGFYPHITSTLVIPYIHRTYDNTIYDGSVYPPIENVPNKYAISKRNEWMIQKSDVLVCYISHTHGGAYKTYEYCLRKKKRIINLAHKINPQE